MIPSKPFDSFKWRWLSVQPTEGLIDPPVFLGVLRALAKFESQPPTIPDLLAALEIVKSETKTKVDLARTPERNLVRNSGQYWKGTGLLRPTTGKIELTDLGRQVASGSVTQGEFAAIMIQQTLLPNRYTFSPSELSKWQAAGLEIKPLKLILDIIDGLGIRHGRLEAYMTPNELIKITIPLSGIMADIDTHIKSVMDFRRGRLDITGWPDCTPGANDKRMAREFLLFLNSYGLCAIRNSVTSRYDQKFYLSELFDNSAIVPSTTISIYDETPDINEVISSVRNSALPSIIERQRTIASIIARPGQPRFRQDVLQAYNKSCLITGESMQEVLEAAHIIPVENGGADESSNGLCLRVDIHRLFDSGNIKIDRGGDLSLSESTRRSRSYEMLPTRVQIPPFVSPANLEWRLKYY